MGSGKVKVTDSTLSRPSAFCAGSVWTGAAMSVVSRNDLPSTCQVKRLKGGQDSEGRN